MSTYNIATICGDGIGKEVIPEAVKVLQAIGTIFGHDFQINYVLAGKDAYEKEGSYFPEKTKKACDKADAILFGAVEKEPLLELRKRYDLFCNIRPVKGNGLDIIIFRELTGGIYYGASGEKIVDGVRKGYHTEEYSLDEIRRIARKAFEYARANNKKVTSVDKDNALPMLKWRDTIDEVAREFPEVSYNHLYIDNAVAQLNRNPKQFEVVVASNMFGDIFSGLAAAMSGSIGMAASASLNERGFGMYEPVHGTAPDIAGKGIANPIGAILSVKMMLENFGLQDEAKTLERAVESVLKDYATQDMAIKGKEVVGTQEMGDLIVEALKTWK